MPSRDVEFRLLQVVKNPLGDERQTVALVHWDGHEMRLAWSLKALPRNLRHISDDIQDVLNAATSVARPLTVGLHLPASLEDVYPVPEGLGSVLVWSPKHVGVTRDPAKHFNELVQALGLQTSTRLAADESVHRVSRKDIASQLRHIGDRMIAELDTDRIHTRRQIGALGSYESPLSWLNGRWHHAFPLDLAKASVVLARVQATLGKIDVVLPEHEVGVILAVHPSASDMDTALSTVERFVHDRFRGRVECMRAPLKKAGMPEFDELQKRIRADVSSAPQLQALRADVPPPEIRIAVNEPMRMTMTPGKSRRS